jgi:hypothetical protein
VLLLDAAFGLAAIFSLSLWCIAGRVLARLITAYWRWRLTDGLLGILLASSIVPIWLP